MTILVVLFVYAFLIGSSAVGSSVAGRLWAVISVLALVVLVLLWGRASEDDTERVRFTIEADRVGVESDAGGSSGAPGGGPSFSHDHDGSGSHTHD